MAKRVQTLLLDDLDTSGETLAAETVPFSLDGTAYEIDLSTDNAMRLRAELSQYIDAARQTNGKAKRQQRPRTAATPPASLTPPFTNGAVAPGDPAPPLALTPQSRSVIRDWYNSNYPDRKPVGKKGRIASRVIDLYRAAH
jgi:hypothetical protein